MTYAEFVVSGRPVSNRSPGPKLQGWRTAVRASALRSRVGGPLSGILKAVVINFHRGTKPSLDVDNMSKPILDSLQTVLYADDRPIRQAEIAHVRVNSPFVIAVVPIIVAAALLLGDPFVYVRIADPIEPYPLSR